jgi:hypothetical protein
MRKITAKELEKRINELEDRLNVHKILIMSLYSDRFREDKQKPGQDPEPEQKPDQFIKGEMYYGIKNRMVAVCINPNMTDWHWSKHDVDYEHFEGVIIEPGDSKNSKGFIEAFPKAYFDKFDPLHPWFFDHKEDMKVRPMPRE